MTRGKYERVCRAVFHGEGRQVENAALHEQAEVFNCAADTFNVRVGGELRQWSRQVCEEAGEKGRACSVATTEKGEGR